MLSILASLLSTVAGAAAAIGSNACMLFWADEPECPKSLLK